MNEYTIALIEVTENYKGIKELRDKVEVTNVCKGWVPLIDGACHDIDHMRKIVQGSQDGVSHINHERTSVIGG